ncbi:MAG: hypothetical protein JSS82_03970 [Bacteroidetes bacterium]|nr:hypothetical protein [Bacteroidota bacterium]
MTTTNTLIVPPYKVIHGLKNVAPKKLVRTMTFESVWKKQQQMCDTKRSDGVQVHVSGDCSLFPDITDKDFTGDILSLPCESESDGFVIFQRIVDCKCGGNETERNRYMTQWDDLCRMKHIPQATLQKLGIEIHDPELFDFEEPVVTEEVVVTNVIQDNTEETSDSEDLPSVSSVKIVGRKPPEIEASSQNTGVISLDMPDSDCDSVGDVPNELELTEYAGDAISVSRVVRPPCPIQKKYKWHSTESRDHCTQFAGINQMLINSLDMEGMELARAVYFMNSGGTCFSVEERKKLLAKLEPRKKEIVAFMGLDEEYANKSISCILKQYSHHHHHNEVEFACHMALLKSVIWPERITPVQSIGASFAETIMNSGHRGHRAHGGNVSSDIQKDVDNFEKFRRFLGSQFDELNTHRHQLLEAEELRAVEAQIQADAQDDASDVSGTMQKASEFFSGVGSSIRETIVETGRVIKSKIKNIANLMEEHTPESTVAAEEELDKLKNIANTVKYDLNASKTLISNEGVMLIAETEKKIDGFVEDMNSALIATEVSEEAMDSVKATSELIQQQTVSIPNVKTGKSDVTTLRVAAARTHRMMNRLIWWFHNPKDVKHIQAPFELSMFMSFLGNICSSSEVIDVSDSGSLLSPKVMFQMPDMSTEERYSFVHPLLLKIEQLLKDSFLKNESLGAIMRAEFVDGVLNAEQIQDILSLMSYIGSMASDPIRAQRVAGHAKYHNKNMDQFYAAAYDAYISAIRIDPIYAKKTALVSVRRLVEATIVCQSLLCVCTDIEHRQLLQKDRVYYMTLAYSNSKTIKNHLEYVIDNFIDHAHEDDCYSSDSDYSDDETLENEPILEEMVERDPCSGVGSLSPCVCMNSSKRCPGSSSSVVNNIPKLVAVHQSLPRCSNYHDFSHVLHHNGVVPADLYTVRSSS